MKKLSCILPFYALVLVFGNIMGQEIIRTPFLQIGDAPFRQNITKEQGTGFSMYTVSTEDFDDAVKNEIKAQKKEGFLAVDKANLLFGVKRTLDSDYPVVAGMTYRIVAISSTQKETFILRAAKEDGTLLVPELQIPGDFRKGTLRAQLADYKPSQNGIIHLKNETMSKDSNNYSAVCYLIFKRRT